MFLSDDYAEDEVQVLGISDLSALKGRNIIVIEDMVDTGNSMKKLLNLLSKHGPNSVKGEKYCSLNMTYMICVVRLMNFSYEMIHIIWGK